MSQSYKGYTVPSYTDVGDAPKAFQDFADSIDTVIADPTQPVGQALAAKVDRTNGTVTTADATRPVVRNIHLSTANPTPQQGMDGDVWIVYV
jgi:hypothetical protein